MRNVLLALAAVVGFSLAGISFAAAHPPIDIVASNWKFTPSEITVHVGEAQAIRLTSSEGVHGLTADDDLGLAQTTIMPNKFVEVTFTPKKAGTFLVHCSVVCGAGHADMVLKVKVEPK